LISSASKPVAGGSKLNSDSGVFETTKGRVNVEAGVPLLLLTVRVTNDPEVGVLYRVVIGPGIAAVAGIAPVPKLQKKLLPGKSPVEVLMNVTDCPSHT
jgi:hypothetical protein